MSRTRISFYEVVSDCTALATAIFIGTGGVALMGAQTEVVTQCIPETTLTTIGKYSLLMTGLSVATGIYATRKEQKLYTKSSQD